MGTEPLERKLAAILYADVASYSRLTGEDEEGTHRALSAYLDAITASIEKHNGTVLHFAGDAVLADFATVSDALICAVAVQQDLKHRNKDLPDERKVQFRIGINLGEVIVDRNEIYGDGVNVAARLETLAEPGGICISESVYTAVGNKLPLEYEFIGEQEVKNIAKPVRAYSATLKADAVLPTPSVRPKSRRPMRHLIVATAAVLVIGVGVITWLAPWAPTIEPASEEQMAFPLPEQPSIAVLPFDNLSGDPAQDAIADGFSESLITTLAQMPELFVIARNSTFTYKGKPVKVKQVAEELGVRYVLEGSIQREGDTLRITAQLIDAVKGHHLWADRYDRDVNAMFAVQDEITREIFTALQVKLTAGEHGRVWQQGTDNFEAYLTWLEGWKHYRQSTKDDNAIARQLILKAIDMDPDWAMPYTTVTWTHWKDIFHGWRATPDESLKQAEEYAQKALALDDTYPGVYAALGAVEGIKGDLDQAIAYHEKAVALGPNVSVYHAILADNLNLAGRSDEAIALLRKAMRLEPTYQPWYLGSLGDAYTSAGKYEEAVKAYKQFLKRRPQSTWGHVGLIVNHMWLDRQNEARSYAGKLLESKPKFTLSSYSKRLKYKDAAYVERLLDALRKAGLPDQPPLALPDKPSIAVLPFANMSDDPKQEYFVDGMTDDLITDLSKISGLFVIARNSTFAYKGKSPDVRQVSRELGVKYVLEGSVRRAGEQVRINAQLIDATTGGHVWAERYDGSLANVFAMQDEVTQKIVTALAVSLTTEEKAARAQQETNSPEAYDAFLRGRAHYNFFSPDDLAKAIPYLEKAIQLEPNYARAHGVLAALYWYVGDSGWAQSMGMSYDDTLKKMEHHLKEALKNPTPLAHHIASQFLTSQGRNDEALAEAKRAVALDPNDATGYIAMAKVYNNTGRPAQGLEAMKKSMRLDPQGDVVGDLSSRLGESYFHLDRFEEAAAAYKKAQERSSGDEWRLLYLATTYGHLERKQEAQSALEKFNNARAKKGRRPYTLAAMDGWQFADETIRERFREGLRKAGVPPGAPSPPLAFRGVMKAPLEIAGATTIDATEAKALFDRGVPFVDVRGDPGWKRGHISGAVHLHVYHDVTEAKLSKVAAKDEEVVIYAHGPGAGVSTRAVASAVSMGFKKVYFFREGLPGWKAAGYPVEAPSG